MNGVVAWCVIGKHDKVVTSQLNPNNSMYSCYLYPPNSLSLSDSVIGNVATRAPTTEVICSEELSTVQSPPPQPLRKTNHTTSTVAKNPQPRKRSAKALNAIEKTFPVPFTDVNKPVEHPRSATFLRQLQRKQQHRERCRQNQARYREKQLKLITDLENDNNRLRTEINLLELRQHSSSTGVPTAPTVWSVASEYFRLFRRGFKSPSPALYSYALAFFEKSMASDIVHGTLLGSRELLEKWQVFSSYFDEIDFKIKRLEENNVESVLVATTTTSFTITSDSLRTVFPHLNNDGQGGSQGGEWSVLATKVVDQRLVLCGSVKFFWDDATDRVVRMETQSDLLTPMLHILGSLTDVSQVFNGAFVKPDCTLLPRPML
ncbi:hypothetical protein L917_15874 [Phytophthora nicotianae]|uniref:BZIP domain-containing protein n=1 Tax=Phytophthora nicotianae TaxID=4792 RepID=W2KGJ3_PHYNI|nr:hypothetical protein L917_15874 [Phytophthora nicotianae]